MFFFFFFAFIVSFFPYSYITRESNGSMSMPLYLAAMQPLAKTTASGEQLFRLVSNSAASNALRSARLVAPLKLPPRSKLSLFSPSSSLADGPWYGFCCGGLKSYRRQRPLPGTGRRAFTQHLVVPWHFRCAPCVDTVPSISCTPKNTRGSSSPQRT